MYTVNAKPHMGIVHIDRTTRSTLTNYTVCLALSRATYSHRTTSRRPVGSSVHGRAPHTTHTVLRGGCG